MVKRILAMLLVSAALAFAGEAGAQAPMPYGAPISLVAAKEASAAAAAEAAKNSWGMAIAVVDPAGILVYFERLPDTQYGAVKVAISKARTATLFRRPTKAFEDALAAGRMAILGLEGATPLEGGVPIVSGGKIIGAIGAAGGTAQQDGQCATAGAAAIK